jgi:hypothetical protein
MVSEVVLGTVSSNCLILSGSRTSARNALNLDQLKDAEYIDNLLNESWNHEVQLF